MKLKKKNKIKGITLLRLWLKKRNFSQKVLVILGATYLLGFFINILSTQWDTIFPKNFIIPEVNSIATSDLTADRSISFKDEKETLARKEKAMNEVPPVFNLNVAKAKASSDNLNKLRTIFFDIQNKKDAVRELKKSFSVEFPERSKLVSEADLEKLFRADNPEIIFQTAIIILEENMYAGFCPGIYEIREQYKEFFTTNEIEIWKGDMGKTKIAINDLITNNFFKDWVMEKAKSFKLKSPQIDIVYWLVNLFSEVNCYVNIEQTKIERHKAADAINVIFTEIVKGQPILQRGQKVTGEIYNTVIQFKEARIKVNIFNLLGAGLFLSIVMSFVLLGISLYTNKKLLEDSEIIFLCGVSLVYLLLAGIMAQFNWDIDWPAMAVAIPTATFIILIAVTIAPRTGLLFAVILPLAGLYIFKMDLQLFLFSFFSGAAGFAIAQGAKKRIDFVTAGVYLAVINIIVLLTIVLINNSSILLSVKILQILGWGAANGFFAGILSLGFLPLVEHFLNTTTVFRLIELSDLNSPIMKKMLSLAPGTYTHSISVANLSESACEAIGANALLARVGAYYHDIGKIDQPVYFIENQREGNKHDVLKPSLSVSVIKSHLKLGIEKAKELGLPKKIIDIVSQHHGRGLISYFYHRALKNNNDGPNSQVGAKQEKIAAEDYSYNGERPQSKEAAVVLLSDAVEAASRTLKKPTVAKLEKFVWSIIMDKFHADELNESDLTFHDLEKIKKSFVHVLAGYFHSRIEYPKIREEGL